jgi:hypothetical protein
VSTFVITARFKAVQRLIYAVEYHTILPIQVLVVEHPSAGKSLS